ncbi:hypothetical protein DMB66_27690 [Actinoplanes sp. ATCC 53533]|uniref:hypothetical protein n=1 Tax=Actinoplanes sp. ATCC 53533 TaxID=1288362 RepID=UPI000F778B32|nr:hypothetical protein [Actinoplanes sp. ATCC 53533]RSM59471.1 hypothetical protein DMB66_27690 [Actinoplanes sp. ATCC 53533]
MRNHTDTFEALAARCERGAETLEHEAAHAAEILAERGHPNADAQDWATRKAAAATAAREYAAGLRADAAAGPGPDARLDPGRLAQAEKVASAAELGGILIDGRPMAERDAQSDSVFNQHTRELWEAGKHPAQEKAQQIEATGKFTHVDETIGGVKQVPFWQLGRPADENTSPRYAARTDSDADEF